MTLVDDATGRTLGAVRRAGNDLGGGRCVAPRGSRRTACRWRSTRIGRTSMCGCRMRRSRSRGPCPLTQFGRMCAALGIQIIAGEFAAGQGPGRAQSRDASGSPGEETAAVGHRGRARGECVSRDDVFARAQRALRAARPPRPTTFIVARPAGPRSIAVFRLEETRVLSNDWVVRYDTRYFQVARQSGQAPARSTVVVREGARRRD